MRRIVALLIAAAAVIGVILLASSLKGDGSVRGQEGTPTPPPQCLVPADLDVSIVIDRTGSMGTNYSGTPPETRLYWAKLAAITLVDGMAGGPLSHSLGAHHVEVITFDGADPPTRVIAFTGDADAVRAAINAITTPPSEVDTYIAPALTMATGDLNSHVHGGPRGSYKVVVLLSDGRNYANGDPITGTTCNATHQRRADTEAAIPGLHAAADSVYTVSIGDPTTCGPTHDQLCAPENCNPNELDEYLMMDITKAPGDHTNALDASTLPDIYSEISQEVVNICVNFSGHKYDDLSCNGPSGLVPLAGINMVLLQGNTVVDQKTTDQGGAYIFVNELPGTYLICEDIPANRIQTYPTSGSGIVSHPPYGNCYERTLSAPGESTGDLDFHNCVPPTPTPTPTPTFTPTPTSHHAYANQHANTDANQDEHAYAHQDEHAYGYSDGYGYEHQHTRAADRTRTNTPHPTGTVIVGVGGTVKLPPAAVDAAQAPATQASSSPLGMYLAFIAGIAGALALATGGWYAGRHRLR